MLYHTYRLCIYVLYLCGSNKPARFFFVIKTLVTIYRPCSKVCVFMSRSSDLCTWCGWPLQHFFFFQTPMVSSTCFRMLYIHTYILFLLLFLFYFYVDLTSMPSSSSSSSSRYWSLSIALAARVMFSCFSHQILAHDVADHFNIFSASKLLW